jgi:hypothetical protein
MRRGDINCEYEGSDTSGGVGSVRYAFAGCVGIDGGRGVDFGGDAIYEDQPGSNGRNCWLAVAC